MSLGLQNDQGFPHQGYLDYTDLGVDSSTGTIRRRAIFPNVDGLLLPGLFVRLRTAIGDPTPKLLVDERAIGASQEGTFLLVVNDQNTVEPRPVTLGLQTDSLRVIEAGIDAEDWLVIDGLQRARGSDVQFEQVKMSGTIEQVGAVASPETAEATKTPLSEAAEATQAQAEPDQAQAVSSESPDAQQGDPLPAASTSKSPAPEEH